MRTKLILVLLLLACAFLSAVDIPQNLPATNMISVSVTGYVTRPGNYQFLPTNRLSDAVDAAMLGNQPMRMPTVVNPATKMPWQELPDTTFVDGRALRSIRLTRQGKTTVCDLRAFMLKGDIEQNPLLRDGDVINVPSISQTVNILGMIYEPGDYEYLPGDTLQKIFELAKGIRQEADLSKVTIYRYADNMQDFQILHFDLGKYNSDPSVANIPLKNADRIIVPENSLYRRKWKVQVTGRVVTPGEYLIDSSSTLYDVLSRAGGPTKDGDLSMAIYLNQAFNESFDAEFERLKGLTMTQMTPLEYNYMRTRMRQIKGKYSVDIEKIWNSKGTEENLSLHDGDVIYIPERLDMVWVSGQVRRPGMQQIIPGKDWKYYIAEAGGFTNNRRGGGIRVIRYQSGNWVKPTKSMVLMPGDIIFVPEKTDRDVWTDIKDILLLATQVVTIFVGVSALTK